MYPEFPEDNKNEDFLNEFRQKIAEQPTTTIEERKNELNRSKSVFVGAVAGVALAGVVGWFVLSPRYAQENEAEIPVIRRPQTAIKVQPSEPGGMEILNQDKSVYAILDKKEENKKVVENLLPLPEEPQLPVIVASEAEVADSKENVKETPEETKNNVIAQAEEILATDKTFAKEVSKPTVLLKEETVVSAAKIKVKEEKEPVKNTEAKKETTKKVEVKTTPQTEKIEISEEFLDLQIPTGLWQVQLMSSSNKDAIEKAWDNLSKKYASLKNQPYEIETADLGEKGIYYRLKAGAFKAKTLADGLCNDIKSAGGSCIVKKK